MKNYSNAIDLIVKDGEKKVLKRICFDIYNGQPDLVTACTLDGRKVKKENIGIYEPVEYHINIAKVFEKYYVDREELDDFEKMIAVMYFTKPSDLYKIAEGNDMLMHTLKTREKISNNPKMIEKYLKDLENLHEKDFD